MAWNKVSPSDDLWGIEDYRGVASYMFEFQGNLIALVTSTVEDRKRSTAEFPHTFYQYRELSEYDKTYQWDNFSGKIEPLPARQVNVLGGGDPNGPLESPLDLKYAFRDLVFDTTVTGLRLAADPDFPDLYLVSYNDSAIFVAKYSATELRYLWVKDINGNLAPIKNPGGYGIDPAKKGNNTQAIGFLGSDARLSRIALYGDGIYLSHWGGLSRLNRSLNQFELMVDLSQTASIGYTTGMYYNPNDDRLYVATSYNSSPIKEINKFYIEKTTVTGEAQPLDDTDSRKWELVARIPSSSTSYWTDVKDIFLSKSSSGILVGLENAQRKNVYNFDPATRRGIITVEGIPTLSNSFAHALPGAVSGTTYFPSSTYNVMTVSNRLIESITNVTPTNAIYSMETAYLVDSYVNDYIKVAGNSIISGRTNTTLGAVLPTRWTSTEVRPVGTTTARDTQYSTYFKGAKFESSIYDPQGWNRQHLWKAHVDLLTRFAGQVFLAPHLTADFTPSRESNYTISVNFGGHMPYSPDPLHVGIDGSIPPLRRVTSVSLPPNTLDRTSIYVQLIATFKNGLTLAQVISKQQMDTLVAAPSLIGKELLFDSNTGTQHKITSTGNGRSFTAVNTDRWASDNFVTFRGASQFLSFNTFNYTLKKEDIVRILDGASAAGAATNEITLYLVFSMYLGDTLVSYYPYTVPDWCSAELGVESITITEDASNAASATVASLQTDSLVETKDDAPADKQALFQTGDPAPDRWFSVFNTRSRSVQLDSMLKSPSATSVTVRGGLKSNYFALTSGAAYELSYGFRWDGVDVAAAASYPVTVKMTLSDSDDNVLHVDSNLVTASSIEAYATSFRKTIYTATTNDLVKVSVIFTYDIPANTEDAVFGRYHKTILLSDVGVYYDKDSSWNDVYMGNNIYYSSLNLDVSAPPTYSNPILPTKIHNYHSISNLEDESLFVIALDEIYQWDGVNIRPRGITEEDS